MATRLATALIAPISFAIVSLNLLRTNSWATWGIEALPSATPTTVSFGDLANITATAECIAAQTPIENCDPYGRPFQPYVELPAQILNTFGLGANNIQALGLSLALIFLITITALAVVLATTWQKSFTRLLAAQALIALISISPASMLAVERGQIEQLTLALVVFALITFSITQHSRYSPLKYLGSVSSFLATTTKYLSIGMFLPFIHRNMFIRKNAPIFIGLILSAIFILISLPSVLQATETSGANDPKTTKSAFGITTLLATAYSGENLMYESSNEVINNWQTITIASYALFITATIAWTAILITARNKKTAANNNEANEREQLPWILTLGSGGVLLFPYLLGSNHDYRLIFLIPLAVGVALLSSQRPVVGTLMAVCAGIAAVTSAPMIPTPGGLIWPTSALVVGDASLLILLSGIAALWLTTAFTKQDTEKQGTRAMESP
jgi:hypothetical protein